MFWLCILCGILTVVIIALLIKIALLHKGIDEVRAEMAERLNVDTNTLISVSGGDRHIKRLAAELNVLLRLLRKERRRLQSGDMELKEAVTNISHDLRTPLTAIRGYLDLLDKEEQSEKGKQYLAVIENRTEALIQLTEDLFRYSMVASESNKMVFENVDMNSVLEESISAYYVGLKGSGITPEIFMPEEKVWRLLDRSGLARVFGNIISNAIRYSDGNLRIELSKQGEILFVNTASNLDEIQVGKLFDRFYTVESGKKSTGLGLSIAKNLVEQMNGKIDAQYVDHQLRICIVFPESQG